jgi:hypothetical protein
VSCPATLGHPVEDSQRAILGNNLATGLHVEITLLQEAGFDPEKVFLLRHEDKREPSGLYQAWRSAPKDFEAYQSGQKWKNRFPEGSSLAAFVVGPEGETLFVSMYEVLKLSRLDGPFDDPLLGRMPAEDRSRHETEHSDQMQDYE